ncbi:MAG: FliI/YscN family ATPase [Deltaproteobacteria bacterium]|nr:FliI/YscN family ATPase [Deltaproteobacteria bacterium]
MPSLLPSFATRGRALCLPPPELEGRVTQVLGMLVEGTAHNAAVGDLYRIANQEQGLLAEVVALKGEHAILMPFGHLAGLRVGASLSRDGAASTLGVGPALLGRVIDAFGRPLDGRPTPTTALRRPIYGAPLPPLARRPVADRLSLGVRVLDAFVPCGSGQRLGIFAGAGVGKSVLLGMIARATVADVVVLALVGERGREVGHFVQEILGARGLAKAVVVVATSDRPPPERVRAAFVATTIAEYFRDQGKAAILFVDSLTRFSMAQREIGLAVGEPPATKGYPPSAFALMPQLLERAAPAREGGSVTGLYTVLVEGDDLNDPVADAARGLLDGHIVLSRRLAQRGQFPAVDVLQSLSRLEGELSYRDELVATRKVRGWLSRLEESRDLVAVGAYRAGSDRELDAALRISPRIDAFMRQAIDEPAALTDTQARLRALNEEKA